MKTKSYTRCIVDGCRRPQVLLQVLCLKHLGQEPAWWKRILGALRTWLTK